ncbi:MAG: NAD(P)-dependent oxidoreductase [Polyangiaceae bacterium]|nr:NAD(P)-dependent oxidoreductase [Polyangiaceae bacterium]
MKTVLVTGARGTVGNYVVGLAEAAGYRVVVSDVEQRGLRAPVRGEVRAADLRDPSVFPALVKGCDFVVHAAAQLSVSADAAELAKTNTDAVVGLYEAAQAAGAKRFVHISIAMLYAAPQGRPVVEGDALEPRGPYGLSKHAAEVYLRSHEGPDALPWTILRAAPIYGRRGRHFAASMLALGPLLRLALPIVPKPAGGPLGTMVHAEDVARAALFVLERETCAFEVYNVSDGDVMTLGERIGHTIDAYGLRTFETSTVPAALWKAVGRTFAASAPYHGADLAALAGWKYVVARHGLKPALRPRLDREAMTLLYRDLIVDSQKLRALGWKPRFSEFEKGWAEVLKWYQAEGWVPRY